MMVSFGNLASALFDHRSNRRLLASVSCLLMTYLVLQMIGHVYLIASCNVSIFNIWSGP